MRLARVPYLFLVGFFIVIAFIRAASPELLHGSPDDGVAPTPHTVEPTPAATVRSTLHPPSPRRTTAFFKSNWKAAPRPSRANTAPKVAKQTPKPSRPQSMDTGIVNTTEWLKRSPFGKYWASIDILSSAAFMNIYNAEFKDGASATRGVWIINRTVAESITIYDWMAQQPVELPPKRWTSDTFPDGFMGHKLPRNDTMTRRGDPKACHAETAEFDVTSDVKCLEYMSDPNNWLSIKPIPGYFRTARPNRSKFIIRFADENLTAVFKMQYDWRSGKKPIGNGVAAVEEASNEYLAFLVDRELQIHRVPPTAWISAFPVAYLMAALTTIRNNFHVHYFEYLLAHMKSQHDLFTAGGPLGQGTVSGCMQLWVQHLRPPQHSRLASILASEHSRSSVENNLTKSVIVSEGLKIVAASMLDVDVTPDTKVTEAARSSPWWSSTLADLSTLFAFDYIIGQTDRGARLNMLVHDRLGRDLRPRLMHVDQGIAFCSSHFYCSSFHVANPLIQQKRGGSKRYCRSSRRLVERVLKMSKGEPELWKLYLYGPVKTSGAPRASTLPAFARVKLSLSENITAAGTVDDSTIVAKLRQQIPPALMKGLMWETLLGAAFRLEALALHFNDCPESATRLWD